MKLPKFKPFTTWNPTKLFAHKQCPLRAQLRYALKLCGICFKGSFGFDKPCDKCKKMPEKSDAQTRGIRLDEAVFKRLSGAEPVDPVTKHPKVLKLIQSVEHAIQEHAVRVYLKHSISLSPEWKLLPKFTKGPWFWGELDALMIAKGVAKVRDWKSGGVNKKTGEPYPNEDYEKQLLIYGVATLCAFPEVQTASSELVFLDAKPPYNPVVKGPEVTRKKLPVLQRQLEGELQPLFSDTIFGPRPGWYCDYCDYRKDVGGPCKY